MANATSMAAAMVIDETADAYMILNEKCGFNPQ